MTGVLASHLPITKELVGVLEGVTDEASAAAAIPKIKSLGERLRAADATLDGDYDSALQNLDFGQRKVHGAAVQRILKEKLRIGKISGTYKTLAAVDKALGS